MLHASVGPRNATPDVASAVERGVLRVIGKLVVIGLLVALIVGVGYGAYVNSEGYQDRKAQQEMNHRLEHIR